MTDRLSLTNALADANIERPNAERIATEIFEAIHDTVATKQDLQHAVSGLEERMLAGETSAGRASRTNMLMTVATAVIALATIAAVIVAGRQVTATYENVLYSRQLDAVATFSSAVDATLQSSGLLLKQIVVTVQNEAQGTSWAELRKEAVEERAGVDKAIEVFTAVFPLDQFAPLETMLKDAVSGNRELIDSLDGNQDYPHANYDSPQDAVKHFEQSYTRAARCVPQRLNILRACAFRAGRAVERQFAHDCEKSL